MRRARAGPVRATHISDYAEAVKTTQKHLKEARTATAAKADFLANMSHELCNPLPGHAN